MIQKEGPFTHLRPSTTPEMLDRTYSVAVRSAAVLWVASLFYGADHLMSIVLNQFPEVDGSNPYLVASMLAMALIGDFAAAIALLALFQGLIFPLRPLSPKALFRTGLRKLPGFFLSHLLYMIAVIIMGIIAWGFFSGQDAPGGDIGRIVAGTMASLVGLWIAVRLCLAPIACLIEDSSPLASFARSWHLTSTRPALDGRPADYPPMRWLAATALPVAIAVMVAAAVAGYGYFQLNVRIPVSWEKAPVSNLVDLFAFGATWIAMPIYWAGTMALYVEYRMRHEALDFYLRIRERNRPDGEELDTSLKTS